MEPGLLIYLQLLGTCSPFRVWGGVGSHRPDWPLAGRVHLEEVPTLARGEVLRTGLCLAQWVGTGFGARPTSVCHLLAL